MSGYLPERKTYTLLSKEDYTDVLEYFNKLASDSKYSYPEAESLIKEGSLLNEFWLSLTQDIERLSFLFPKHKFVVEVEESNSYLWRFFAKDGKVTRVNSVMIWDYAPFSF